MKNSNQKFKSYTQCRLYDFYTEIVESKKIEIYITNFVFKVMLRHFEISLVKANNSINKQTIG